METGLSDMTFFKQTPPSSDVTKVTGWLCCPRLAKRGRALTLSMCLEQRLRSCHENEKNITCRDDEVQHFIGHGVLDSSTRQDWGYDSWMSHLGEYIICHVCVYKFQLITQRLVWRQNKICKKATIFSTVFAWCTV